MSDMFDPNKLNLDFSDDNNDEKSDKKPDSEAPKQMKEIKIEEEKTPLKQETKEEFNSDVFAALEDSEEPINVSEEEIKQELETEIEEDKAEIEDNIEKMKEDILGEQKSEKVEEISEKQEKQIAEKALDDVNKSEKEEEKMQEDAKKFYAEVPEEEKEDKKVLDQSLSSLEDLIDILYKKKYDFFTIIPSEQLTEISFKKDNKLQETRYISYKIYTKILIRLKTLGKFDMSVDNLEQKKEFEMSFKEQKIKVLGKTAPSQDGEKIFFKPKKTVNQTKANTKKQPISITKIFGFLSALLLVVLIILGAFLAFVVMNAKTPADVAIFSQLGINLTDVNTFIKNTILLVFTILAFVESIILAIFVFRALLTKKQYKRRRIIAIFVSVFMFVMLIGTGSLGLALYKKKLPDWYKISLGAIQIYDNEKLISDRFDETTSAIRGTSNLIGPITLKYDLSNFASDKAQEGFIIQKYIWDFGDGEEIETVENTIIHEFKEKGLHSVKLTIQGENKGEAVSQTVDDIKPVNITAVVKYSEQVLPNGGKRVKFDATALKSQGQIKWYFDETKKEDAPVMYVFEPGQIFMEDTLVGMKIIKNGEEKDKFDKIFVIKGNSSSNIGGKIEYERSIDDDLEFTFKVKNPQIGEGNGFVSKYEWHFGEIVQTITDIDVTSNEAVEKSSNIKHIFKTYGDKDISVRIYDSAGNFREVMQKVKIPKLLKLKSPIEVNVDGIELDKKEIYNGKIREYNLENIGAPSIIKFDARKVKADTYLYRLDSVEWDTDGDGSYDKKSKELEFNVPLEDYYNLGVKLNFVHRRDDEERVEIKENINIDAVEKEAMLKLEIDKSTEYAPAVIGFDASQSKVRDENIIKFVYDYGDGTEPEQRDAINPGHKYRSAGDYTIKLTVVTESGKEFSISKKLILKPKPQRAEITASFRETKVGQGILFSSEKSEGQIERYFWDFGDGNYSNEASPTHTYKKSGDYKVKLKLEFADNNVVTDEYEIKITD